MNRHGLLLGIAITALLSPRADAGSSAALSLLDNSSARYAALGNPAALTNDVSGLPVNPASVASLRAAQASVLYKKNILSDAYSRLLLATPLRAGGIGLDAAFYDGGEIETVHQGRTRRVNAQTDYSLAIGGALKRSWGSLGLTGRYFQSTLAEEYTASGTSIDIGALFPLQRGHWALSLANIGPSIRYHDGNDSLPLAYRIGAAVSIKPSILLLTDAAYLANEQDFRPSLGVETVFSPLSLRANVRRVHGDLEAALGAGFAIGSISLDYAFDWLGEVSRHNASISMRFQGKQKLTHPTPSTTPSQPDKTLSIPPTDTLSFPQPQRQD